jgi:hypothetical protein
MYSGSDIELDAYKGTLLGVEDELVDALINAAYIDRTPDQQALESPASYQSYSRLAHWEERLLGVEEELIDALASFSKQMSDPERSTAMCSNTSSPVFWNPWAVMVSNDELDADSSEEHGMFYCQRNTATALFDTEHLRMNCINPRTLCRCAPPLLAKNADPPGTKATWTVRDDCVVDSIILERSAEISLLDTRDLDDWQGTMGDLLLVDSEMVAGEN